MDREQIAKHLKNAMTYEDMADWHIAEVEKAKLEVAKKARKAILSGNSQDIDNFRNYYKELKQAQDKQRWLKWKNYCY